MVVIGRGLAISGGFSGNGVWMMESIRRGAVLFDVAVDTGSSPRLVLRLAVGCTC